MLTRLEQSKTEMRTSPNLFLINRYRMFLTLCLNGGATIYTDDRRLSDPKDVLPLSNFGLTWQTMNWGFSSSIKESKVTDTTTACLP